MKEAWDGVLRYVGTVDVKKGTASVGLRAFPKTHAFAGTKHADNIVTFSTARYTPQPLVLQGPGAGLGVTAGGVFADLLKQIPKITKTKSGFDWTIPSSVQPPWGISDERLLAELC